jgi:hypothetical protein
LERCPRHPGRVWEKFRSPRLRRSRPLFQLCPRPNQLQSSHFPAHFHDRYLRLRRSLQCPACLRLKETSPASLSPQCRAVRRSIQVARRPQLQNRPCFRIQVLEEQEPSRHPQDRRVLILFFLSRKVRTPVQRTEAAELRCWKGVSHSPSCRNFPILLASRDPRRNPRPRVAEGLRLMHRGWELDLFHLLDHSPHCPNFRQKAAVERCSWRAVRCACRNHFARRDHLRWRLKAAVERCCCQPHSTQPEHGRNRNRFLNSGSAVGVQHPESRKVCR